MAVIIVKRQRREFLTECHTQGLKGSSDFFVAGLCVFVLALMCVASTTCIVKVTWDPMFPRNKSHLGVVLLPVIRAIRRASGDTPGLGA